MKKWLSVRFDYLYNILNYLINFNFVMRLCQICVCWSCRRTEGGMAGMRQWECTHSEEKKLWLHMYTLHSIAAYTVYTNMYYYISILKRNAYEKEAPWTDNIPKVCIMLEMLPFFYMSKSALTPSNGQSSNINYIKSSAPRSCICIWCCNEIVC